MTKEKEVSDKEILAIAAEYATNIAADDRIPNSGTQVLVAAMIKFQLEQAFALAAKRGQSGDKIFLINDGGAVPIVPGGA